LKQLKLFLLLCCMMPIAWAAPEQTANSADATPAVAAAPATTPAPAATSPTPAATPATTPAPAAASPTPAATPATTPAPAAASPAPAATPATTPTPAAKSTSSAAATPTPTATPTSATEPLLPGDAERGLAKSSTCVACHGTDGNSIIPDYPKIAGQNESYIIESLHEFKEGPGGERDNPIMFGMVANLSEQDMLDLASYYASQKVTLGEVDPALVELGQSIYRGGNIEAGVPACIACHGPRGEGNTLARFPALSGQNAAYVEAQLHAFRSGTRKGGVNDMMTQVVARMSEDEIKAVASYVSGLH